MVKHCEAARAQQVLEVMPPGIGAESVVDSSSAGAGCGGEVVPGAIPGTCSEALTLDRAQRAANGGA